MKGRDAWRAAWRIARCIAKFQALERAVIASYGSLHNAMKVMVPCEYDAFMRTWADVDMIVEKMKLDGVPSIVAGLAVLALDNRGQPERLVSMRGHDRGVWRFVRRFHPRLRLSGMAWPHGRLP